MDLASSIALSRQSRWLGNRITTLARLVRITLVLVPISCVLIAGAQQKASGRAEIPGRAEIIDQLHQGNNQQALSLANEALKANPRDCSLLSLRAVAFTALGQQQPALQSFEQALAQCPAYLPALEGAAQIQFSRQSPEAIPLLDRIVALQPANTTAHAMLASTLRTQNKCAGALAHFKAGEALFSTRPDLLEGYGACLAQSGDLQAALAQYLQLLDSHPNDTVRYDVALLQWKTHANDAALQTLAPLLEQTHEEAAFILAAKIYEEKGDTPRAVEVLRSAILIAPDHPDNYLDFADIAFNHKSFQVGIDMLNAGLTRLPQSAPLYVARGVLEVQLSQSEAAVADFEQAHRLDPTLSFAVDAIGMIETQQHQPGQSLALFESQASLHPDDPLLQYLLAEQLSESTEESMNLGAAIAAAKRAAALDPRYRAAHDLLAVLYLRAKQPRLAMQEAELALALDPNDQDALYQEIMARRRSGETAELPVLVARLNQVRRENARKQQDVDRYRLQDGMTHN